MLASLHMYSMWGVGFCFAFLYSFFSTIWKYACMYMCIIHWSAWHLRGSGDCSQVSPVSDTKDVWDFVDGAPGWIGVLMDERVYISMAVSEHVRDCRLCLELQPVQWCNTGCSSAKSLEKYSNEKKKTKINLQESVPIIFFIRVIFLYLVRCFVVYCLHRNIGPINVQSHY